MQGNPPKSTVLMRGRNIIVGALMLVVLLFTPASAQQGHNKSAKYMIVYLALILLHAFGGGVTNLA